MGEQVRVVDLAEDLIRLSASEPGRTSRSWPRVRPGETQRILWDEAIEYEETGHPDIVSAMEGGLLEGQPCTTIDELVQLAQEDPQAIVGLLAERVPGNRLGENTAPDLTSVV
jgi:FlaA1/EpsC-like NDP-sugar epimerase